MPRLYALALQYYRALTGKPKKCAMVAHFYETVAHYFISNQYWKSNYELVKEMMSQSEVYVFEADKMIQGFVGLNDEYIEGIFVSDEMQSCGIGKLLLDYIKDKKVSLRLNVYQKNARAISFYQREGFIAEKKGCKNRNSQPERIYGLAVSAE